MTRQEIKKCDKCNEELALCIGWVNFINDDEPFDSGKQDEDIDISKETKVYCYICPKCNKIKSEIEEC